jgi:hypothetical protein
MTPKNGLDYLKNLAQHGARGKRRNNHQDAKSAMKKMGKKYWLAISDGLAVYSSSSMKAAPSTGLL